uniref:Uncharacterized protein n=1 Tax=Denticeps clupeoides TaxID=299321 RepID=A0AAY4D2T2_9TELE
MVDVELTKKMLRAVLQSNKNGVSTARLQSDYRALTGEFIPHKQMGYPTLEGFLRSVPSVVRMEHSRTGEPVCFAAVCQETAHIAQLVARQRNSKRTGRSQLVNCHMRVKPASTYVLNGETRPRTSLRQPQYTSHSSYGTSHQTRNKRPSHQAMIANISPCEETAQLSPTLAYSCHLSQIQDNLTQLLCKYNRGVWLSKLPELYKDFFKEDLHVSTVRNLENWKHICLVEKPGSNIADRLVYPAPAIKSSPTLAPAPNKPLSSSLDACSLLTPPASPVLVTQGSLHSCQAVSTDMKQMLRELLEKYSNGLWAHALPKLFQEAYGLTFPLNILSDLSVLADMCVVDYPMPDNHRKAILYSLPPLEGHRAKPVQVVSTRRPALQPHGRPPVPPLVMPKEDYPSVLLVEASSTDNIVLRYVGEGYSQVQEAMEDSMSKYYSVKDRGRLRPSKLTVGGLYAVMVEDDEVLRVQLDEVLREKVKVYYVDHGFSEAVYKDTLLELDEQFLSLPFQASTCKLAGLSPFCVDLEVLRVLESKACGRILLAEILDRDVPLVVLYDTSQEEDININSACLKAMQDKSMANPLQVNSTYLNVSVTNICSDGAIFCQLPSRGLAKLRDVMEKIELHMRSQFSPELLVAKPFCGKICLAHHKGKWSRVEIINLHGNHVLDVLFFDLGLPASLEVTELREIPPPFLRDLMTIPAQGIKCYLAELSGEVGPWSPAAILWLRDTVDTIKECSMRLAKLDEAGQVHIYLFQSNCCQDINSSINRQLLTSGLWKSEQSPAAPQGRAAVDAVLPEPTKEPQLPPVLELPNVGENMDSFVSVACHPGHFVLQPWQDLYKLMVLMGEMILYYNCVEADEPVTPEHHGLYAAKVASNWYRVRVNGILTNGLLSVYELDYGKHELVTASQLRPLIREFRQLPFQAIPAQLAGVTQLRWSEEASMVFRHHVEKKPLVARLESVQEAAQPWDRKVTVYLVDTSQENRDFWVHKTMAAFVHELDEAS